VSTVPVVEVCPNCGAPLELDLAGECRWCHARIRTDRADPAFLRLQDEVRLVPEDADDCTTSAPFLSLALSSLSLLGVQPEIKQYMNGQPGLLRQIRMLSTMVSVAGVRVRDAGLLKDSFDSNLDVYTAEEIWTFDLAFDVITLIGAMDGLTGRIRAMTASNMRSLDGYAERHAWKKAMKKAGDGPVPLREFRAAVPRRG
jgi:hypothetical protein